MFFLGVWIVVYDVNEWILIILINWVNDKNKSLKLLKIWKLVLVFILLYIIDV